MAGWTGKINEKLGWLTADRTKEAQGRLQQADDEDLDETGGTVPADKDAAAAEAVDQAELQVRDEYGDLAPEAKPD